MHVPNDMDATVMLFWRHQSGIHVVIWRRGRVCWAVPAVTSVPSASRRSFIPNGVPFTRRIPAPRGSGPR